MGPVSAVSATESRCTRAVAARGLAAGSSKTKAGAPGATATGAGAAQRRVENVIQNNMEPQVP